MQKFKFLLGIHFLIGYYKLQKTRFVTVQLYVRIDTFMINIDIATFKASPIHHIVWSFANIDLTYQVALSTELHLNKS